MSTRLWEKGRVGGEGNEMSLTRYGAGGGQVRYQLTAFGKHGVGEPGWVWFDVTLEDLLKMAFAICQEDRAVVPYREVHVLYALDKMGRIYVRKVAEGVWYWEQVLQQTLPKNPT